MLVSTFLRDCDRQNPFKDNIPGKDWFKRFERRNKDILTRRKPEILSMARARSFTNEVADGFFNLWNKVLDENNLRERPEAIWNCDETGLSTDITGGSVYVR